MERSFWTRLASARWIREGGAFWRVIMMLGVLAD